MDVSQRLLTKLEEALNGKDFDHQVLGELSLCCLGSKYFSEIIADVY